MLSPLPPVAVLAGGLATRMRPVTSTIPKSLIPVAGRPFIAHQLDLLARNGFSQVVVCCGHLGEQIEEFVGDGSEYGCQVRFSYDGMPLKGTGGAIRKALCLLSSEFFVMYGDSYLQLDYQDAFLNFRSRGKLGLMTVFKNENRWDRSNVEFLDSEIRNYDKLNLSPSMHHIDYGLGIFRAEVFRAQPEDEAFDLASVYQDLIRNRELLGYEVRTRFYEIGTPAGLAETDLLLRTQQTGRSFE